MAKEIVHPHELAADVQPFMAPAHAAVAQRTIGQYVRTYMFEPMVAATHSGPSERALAQSSDADNALWLAIILDRCKTANPLDMVSVLSDPRLQDIGRALGALVTSNPQEAHQLAVRYWEGAGAKARMLWQFAVFGQQGGNIYATSPALADMMRFTEVRGIDCADVRMPYPSIYLIVPRTLPLALVIDGVKHPYIGVYIAEDPDLASGNYRGPGLRFMFIGDDPRGGHDFGLLHSLLPLGPGVKLQDAVDAQQAHDQELLKRKGNAADAEFYAGPFTEIMRYALSTMLYAISLRVDLEWVFLRPEAQKEWEKVKKMPPNSPQRKKRKKELDTAGGPKVRYLGRNVTPWTPDQRKAYGVGQKVANRTLVAGSMRTIRVGPGWSQRRTQWFAPYWRGPEDAPVINPIHKLHGF